VSVTVISVTFAEFTIGTSRKKRPPIKAMMQSSPLCGVKAVALWNTSFL
jgi:hypothetical protein